MTIDISTPLTGQVIRELKAGDRVLLSGTIYTGRDAAHKRLTEMLDRGEKLPVSLTGQVLYYVGPCPARPGAVIGSAGPTTSGRMDVYTPMLLDRGLKGIIGKGSRSQPVINSIIRNNAVYFAAVGGAGALLAQRIKQAGIVAFHELGPEAVYRLRVEKFPLTVVIDSSGNNLYHTGREKYRKD